MSSNRKSPRLSTKNKSIGTPESKASEETPKKQKNPRKRPRSTSNASQDDSTPMPEKKRAKTSKKQTQSQNNDDAMNDPIYEAVNSKSGLVLTIDEWVKNYTESKSNSEKGSSALLELVNFIIHSAGCKTSLTLQQFNSVSESGEIADLIKSVLTKDAKWIKEADYPIKSKTMKRFRPSFCEFWKKLIKATQNSIIFDKEFLPVLTEWLSGISIAPQRALRHTATLAGLEIALQLAEVAASLQTGAETAERMGKATKKGSTTTAKGKQNKLQKVNELLDNIYQQIFYYRFRDSSEDIRADCITALGNWVVTHPTHFLTNDHLRFIGWMLSDKQAVVRKAAVQAVIKMIEKLHNTQVLTEFLTFYHDRLTEMPLDKDTPTATEAVRALRLMSKHDLLQEDDVDKLSRLIADKAPQLRVAIADFIAENVMGEQRESASQKKKKKKQQPTEGQEEEEEEVDASKVVAFVEFVQGQLEHNDLIPYIVDSMWERTPVLTAWQLMAQLVVDEDGDLNADQRGVLLAVLVNAVKKASGYSILAEHKDKEPVHSEVEEKHIQKFGPVLAKSIPTMLSKFAGAPSSIAYVAELTQYVPVDCYTSFRLQSQFKQLLEGLQKSFLASVDPNVQKQICNTFRYLLQEHALKREVETTFQTIAENVIKTCVKQLKTASQNKNRSASTADNDGDDSSEAANSPLTFTCQRLANLANVTDVTKVDETIYDTLEKALVTRSENSNISPGAVVAILEVLSLSLGWRLSRLIPGEEEEAAKAAESDGGKKKKRRPSSGASETQEKADDAGELHDKANKLLDCCIKLLTDPAILVREQALITACDLLVLFSPYLETLHDKLGASLAITATASQVSALQTSFELLMCTPTDLEDDASVSRKLRLVEAFAKTITTNVLTQHSEEYASYILVHFVRHGPEVSDLIKAFLHELRETPMVNHADHVFMFNTLVYQWNNTLKAIEKGVVPTTTKATSTGKSKQRKSKSADVDEDQNEDGQNEQEEEVDDESAPYVEFIRLARKLASTYGIAGPQRKQPTREALLHLLRRCLNYVSDQPRERGPFAKYGVSHFASKIDYQMAEKLLELMDRPAEPMHKLFANIENEDDEALAPYLELKQQIQRIAKGQKSPRKPAKKTGAKAKKAGGARSSVTRALADEFTELEEEPAESPKKKKPTKTRSFTRKRKAVAAEEEDESQSESEDEGEDEREDEDEAEAPSPSPRRTPRKRGSAKASSAKATPAKRTPRKKSVAAEENDEGEAEAESEGEAESESEAEAPSPSPRRTPRKRGSAKASPAKATPAKRTPRKSVAAEENEEGESSEEEKSPPKAKKTGKKRKRESGTIYDSDDESIRSAKRRKKEEEKEKELLADVGIGKRASRSARKAGK